MSRSPERVLQAWRLGLFVLGGLGVLAAAVVFVLGGGWLAERERAAMRFDGSVHGLKVGAPVVFRGVRVGEVSSFELVAAAGGPAGVRVLAVFERAALRTLAGDAAAGTGPLVPALVQRGLVARLATQSLLTGQLYVDLDLRAPAGAADAAAAASAAASAPTPTPTPIAPPATLADGLAWIPTQASTTQALQAQFERMDFAGLLHELQAAAAATRRLAAEAPLKPALEDVSRLAADLRRVARRLERELAPAAQSAAVSAREAFDAARGTATRWADVAAPAASAAEGVGRAAGELRALAAPDAAIAQAAAAVGRNADELGRTAAALREGLGRGSPLAGELERTAQEVAAAARSARALADLLEKHPDSLWRGRPDNP